MPRSETIHRAFRYRLYPTDDQAVEFVRWAGVVRLIYNLALEQRRDHWRLFKANTGKQISYLTQAKELTTLRAEFEFIRDVCQTCQQQALRDLDRAYGGFFRGECGYPRPRKRGLNDSFRFQGREVLIERLNRCWGRVRLPKIGWIRFRWTRAIGGQVRNVTIAHDAIGWHISFACESEQITPCNANPAVGIDRGVAHAMAMSDGSFADMPMDKLRELDRRARKQGRALARCKRGSVRWGKARKRLAATKAKSSRVRKHFNHVQSHRIATTCGTVVVEVLQAAEMTRSARGCVDQPGRNVRAKAGLNRAILDQGWRQFETFLSYKLEANGGLLITVPAAYTSQTCSACGSISKHHRKSQAVFHCSDCGHSANADTNAAINILRAGTRPSDANHGIAQVVRESREAA